MPNPPADVIFIRELRVSAVIGVYEWEQRVEQTISIDLEMASDIRKAAVSDAIEDTLNYKAVAERVVEYVKGSRFRLIETLAEGIARLILNEFAVQRIRLTIGKPGAVRGAREVGVVIERGINSSSNE
jgi:dihydroneopterin aldolase